MASSKRDFERFVAWLHRPENQAQPDVRRLANLALMHFDGLAETSRRSQRSNFLVERARRFWAELPEGPPDIQPIAVDGAWPWQRLRHLTLGPFRGFRIPEQFDLQKRIVLFYGPNGSGKTSLCEGLEFALLGSVEEADTKRIEARVYLANAHERRFDPPVLRATSHQNREVTVAANMDTFRFCFIEKIASTRFPASLLGRQPRERNSLPRYLEWKTSTSSWVDSTNRSIRS